MPITWKLLNLGLIGIFICFTIGCAEKNQIRTLRLGHGLDVNHPVHQGMLQIDKHLKDLSDGKMRLMIYPNQQLGSERECLELLQIGSLDITKVSAAVMENFVPDFKIFGLPFLFDNKEHLFKVLDGKIGESLLNQGSAFWLKGLGYYDSGSRSFYLKDRLVESPQDLQGLKIRVMESATAIEMMQHLGASPTPISWGELYTSLQQGVVDGAENNPPSFYLSKHYEVCKYYVISEHTTIPDVLLTSTHLWNKLSEIEKKWLRQSVRKSVIFQRKLWVKSEQDALDGARASGIKISYPNKQPFRDAVKPMYKSFNTNPQMAQLIQSIENTKTP
ncbi:MAG: TRAP transporter substrate-binding protein [Flavobacteriaceae bacterium]|nr:TRAP transporter substrate-binding protein [Flavobacteriaceae bacterium]